MYFLFEFCLRINWLIWFSLGYKLGMHAFGREIFHNRCINSTIISAKYRDIREIDSNDPLLPFYVTDFVLLP